MNDTPKLLLAIAVGGVLLGAGLGYHVDPAMNAGPQSDWRDRYRATYSDTSMQFVDAGPFDTSPPLTWSRSGYGLDQRPLYGPYSPAVFAPDEPLADFDTMQEPIDAGFAAPAAPAQPIEEAVHQAATAAARLEQPPSQAARRGAASVLDNSSEQIDGAVDAL